MIEVILTPNIVATVKEGLRCPIFSLGSYLLNFYALTFLFWICFCLTSVRNSSGIFFFNFKNVCADAGLPSHHGASCITECQRREGL